MGFWGTLAFVRTERSALELDAVLQWTRYPDGRRLRDGWQLVGFRHDGSNGWESLLPNLMEETGRPVMGAYVLDSDGAQVVGMGPRTGRWATWLELGWVLAHLVIPPAYETDDGEWDTDEDDPKYLKERAEMRAWLMALGSDPTEAAPAAVRWAEEAGLVADVTEVEQAMNGRGGFVEERFFDLVETLGVPWSE
ncbi:hypothetical protein GCM10029978_100580 [Actinoallomurus acanthiterrae]